MRNYGLTTLNNKYSKADLFLFYGEYEKAKLLCNSRSLQLSDSKVEDRISLIKNLMQIATKQSDNQRLEELKKIQLKIEE